MEYRCGKSENTDFITAAGNSYQWIILLAIPTNPQSWNFLSRVKNRIDYVDKVYEEFADKAQALIKTDPSCGHTSSNEDLLSALTGRTGEMSSL